MGQVCDGMVLLYLFELKTLIFSDSILYLCLFAWLCEVQFLYYFSFVTYQVNIIIIRVPLRCMWVKVPSRGDLRTSPLESSHYSCSLDASINRYEITGFIPRVF